MKSPAAFLLLLTTATAATAADVINATETKAPPTYYYYTMCGADLGGVDYKNEPKSEDTCFVSCRDDPTCGGASWTPWTANGQGSGTCFYKQPVMKNEREVPLRDSFKPNAGVNSFFKTIFGATNDVLWPSPTYDRHGFDMPGNDIGNVPGVGPAYCQNECKKNAKCFAVTRTNYNNGTCWLKSRGSAFVPMQGAWSSTLARSGPWPMKCP